MKERTGWGFGKIEKRVADSGCIRRVAARMVCASGGSGG